MSWFSKASQLYGVFLICLHHGYRLHIGLLTFHKPIRIVQREPDVLHVPLQMF